jgi:lipopolysaccharide export system permease protein
MKLLEKYLLREYLKTLIYCLLGFAVLLVVGDLFEHASFMIDRKPAPLELATYYGLFLAISFEYLAPAALLLGTLYTLWQFSHRSEITAMRAGGVSLFLIMRPFLAVAVSLSLTAVAIKEFVTPYGTEWMSAFLAKSGDKNERVHYDVAYFNGLGRRLWLIGKLDLDAPQSLQQVKITCEREDGTRYQEIKASRAEWLDGQWWLFDAIVQRYDDADNPIGGVARASPGGENVAEFAFLDEVPADVVNEVINWDFLSARAIYRYLQRHPGLSREDQVRKELTLHQRVATPLSGLVAALFAIPAGMRGGRRSAMAGVMLTVGCFFGFYALMQVGAFLALRQWLSPWVGAWLSNIVFLGTGTIMVVRVR